MRVKPRRGMGMAGGSFMLKIVPILPLPRIPKSRDLGGS